MARLDRLALAVALAFAATACSSDADPDGAEEGEQAQPAPSDPGDPAMLDKLSVQLQLHELTRDFATQLGVDRPATMVAVAAVDHAAAEEAISGAQLDEHDPVFVVQVTGGQFTALRHPPNQPAPSGNVLTVTYDAKTLQVLDVGLDEVAPAIERLGKPVDLLQSAYAR